MSRRAVVVGAGSALPPPMAQQALWDGFFRERFADHPVARKVWEHSGIETRRGVADPTVDDVSDWGTGARMERFVAEAMPLGKEAIGAALDVAGISAGDVGLLAVVSCTGYATPGLDIRLSRDLGMSADVQRLHIGHMGCYAAVPGLGAVSDFVVARGRPAVLLCLELTSLHVQPASPDVDLQQVVAHALFSDAAAALVLAPGDIGGDIEGDAEADTEGATGRVPAGLEVVDVVARTDHGTADHMTWDVTDMGFRMGLSPRVPDVLAVHARPVVEELLDRHGIAVADVAGWAIHPGGRRIVEVVGEALDLPEHHLEASYDVLREVGNCSSATVLLVLERLRATRPLAPGDTVVAMAFGPGLTLCATLLRAVG